MKILVGITGSSGVIYGIRLVEVLSKMDQEVFLIISENARRVMERESKRSIEEVESLVRESYDNDDLCSPPASGSFLTDATVIIPCSLKTLSAIANGYADTLISRAGICSLKEGRKTILVIRETPLDLSSLENMVKAKKSGAVILPASPAFYHNPKRVEDLVDFIVGKVLDQLGLKHSLFKRWGQ
ncbi:MAG: UbiX family flavin prenyltransferase [Thermoplasmata archaeon]|nr:UbiX family flavin prenyltransferase [Thermoplasmata archaeon]